MKNRFWKSFLTLSLLSIVLLSPEVLLAQKGPFPKDRISFVGQISNDEEGRELSYPAYVWIDPNRKEIYVVEGRGSIVVYNERFFPLFSLGPGQGVESAQGLMIDRGGFLWVAQAPGLNNRRGRISIFDRCLNWKKDVYLSGFEGADEFTPFRLAENSKGEIFVVGAYSPLVLILDTLGNVDGTLSHEVEAEGARKRVMLNDVLVGPDDRLYFLSEETSHVYVYDTNRRFLFEFGQKGGSTGKMSRPQGLDIERRSGNFFIVDYMRHAITVYDPKGNFIYEFGGLGWGEGWLQYPKDITIDRSGKVFIADTFNNRIQVLQLKDASAGDLIRDQTAGEEEATAKGSVPEEARNKPGFVAVPREKTTEKEGSSLLLDVLPTLPPEKQGNKTK
ncbi:MAG: NHL repeat-containing protein [Pseudomonadota bacterium]